MVVAQGIGGKRWWCQQGGICFFFFSTVCGGGGRRTNRLGLEIVYAFIMQKPFSAPSL